MTLAVYEDETWERFAPLTYTRHVAQLSWGTRTLAEGWGSLASPRDVILWGRPEVAHPWEESGKTYNSRVDGDALFVNARLRPRKSVWALLERQGQFAATCEGNVLALRADAKLFEPGLISGRKLARLAKAMKTIELPQDAEFTGSWQLVESNGLAIAEQAGHFDESLELPEKVTLKGPPSNLRIHGSVEIEGHVSFDTRLGPVVVREGTTIDSFSRLAGPCFLGPGNRVRSALIRGGTSLFEGCTVGGEVENSIMLAHANKAHLGYVGDSIVGEWVNLGAGSVFSNLKNTYGNVKVDYKGERVDTGMMKLGPVIGDMAKVSIGALVFAGKSVGVSSHVLNLVDSDVPSFTYFDGGTGRKVELLLDSAIETQKKMMERRGMTLSKAMEALIRTVFKSTQAERTRAGVRKGKLR